MASRDEVMLATSRLANLYNRKVPEHSAVIGARRELAVAKIRREIDNSLDRSAGLNGHQCAALVGHLLNRCHVDAKIAKHVAALVSQGANGGDNE